MNARSLRTLSTSLATATLMSASLSAAPRQKGAEKYMIAVVDLKPQRTCVVRGTTTLAGAGTSVADALGKVKRFVEAHKLAVVGAPFTRTIEIKQDALTFEAGFPISGEISKDTQAPEVVASELPGGKAATTQHKGSQETSDRAYHAIEAWMKQHGRTPAGPPFEVYEGEAGQGMRVYFPIAP